jgi:oxygen-independent coproporphyrinogen III oxidase
MHDTALQMLRQRPATSAGIPLRASAASGDRSPVRSLYMHIPFCFHKCHYCDFYSIVDRQDRQEAFTDRLCRELGALAPWAAGRPLETIFVGGGTPTLLRLDLWERVLGCLAAHYDLSGMGAGEGEFTVECNPETATAELMACLAAGGVNRVSIGAQSFDRRHLRMLERWHDPENVARAVELARNAGIRRQSLDLIFAIPGQTLADWQEDLRTALSVGTPHLSCYALTYEPRTAMTARLKRAEFEAAGEDLEADMYECTVAMLRRAGLDRYEVSNYAQRGHEARHNLAYWRQEEWLAAGPSASAHVGGHRWKNAPRLDDYLTFDDAGFAAIVDYEEPDTGRALVERIMTGLRLAEGLDAHQVLAASVNAELLRDRVRRWQDSGHLTDSGTRWRLTDAGFLIADAIAADLMGAAR